MDAESQFTRIRRALVAEICLLQLCHWAINMKLPQRSSSLMKRYGLLNFQHAGARLTRFRVSIYDDGAGGTHAGLGMASVGMSHLSPVNPRLNLIEFQESYI